MTKYANGSTFLGMKKKTAFSRKHSKPLQVRVVPAFYDLFVMAAEASGLTLSAWSRERLVQAARRDLKQAGREGLPGAD